MVLSEILQCIFLLLSKFFKPKQEIIGPNFQNEMTNVKSKNVNARRRWRIVIIKSCIDYNKKWCHNWNTYQNIVYISLFIRHDTFNGWSIFKNSYVTLKKNPQHIHFPLFFSNSIFTIQLIVWTSKDVIAYFLWTMTFFLTVYTIAWITTRIRAIWSIVTRKTI